MATEAEIIALLKVSGDGRVQLPVYAQPGARKSQFTGLHDGNVKVKVQAPPIEGKANEALIKFFAEVFGLAKSQIAIGRGELSRKKLFVLHGIDVQTVAAKLAAALAG